MPLFILRFFLVDDTEAAFAAHQLVIRADFFYTRTNFHERSKTPVSVMVNTYDQRVGLNSNSFIFDAEDDSALGEIIGG